MNLVVDIGNTFAKAGAFEGEVFKDLFPKLTSEDVLSLIEAHAPDNIIIGSVGNQRMVEQLLSDIPKEIACIKASPLMKIPVRSFYQSQETLGIDRLAAAIGANSLYPEDNCLVIDAGTCITFDFVDHRGYHGGTIAPGLNMKFKALNTFTARLPLLSTATSVPLLGKSTTEAIQSGVINGSVAEIEGLIDKFTFEFSELKTIICGGDAKFFESRIKAPIFVIPELVLIGLNRILLYNVSNK